MLYSFRSRSNRAPLLYATLWTLLVGACTSGDGDGTLIASMTNEAAVGPPSEDDSGSEQSAAADRGQEQADTDVIDDLDGAVADPSPSEESEDGGVRDDGGLEDGNEASVAPDSPRITQLVPGEVLRGGSVQILGERLSSNSRIMVNGEHVPVLASGAGMLAFTASSAPSSSACKEAAEVVVVTDAGRSNVANLIVTRPGPAVNRTDNLYAIAGEDLVLHGAELEDAELFLGGIKVPISDASPDRITARLERSLLPQSMEGKVAHPCGEVLLRVNILPPRPIIRAADAPSVAPDGIVLLSADLGAALPTSLMGVRVGTTTILASDTAHFAWNPYRTDISQLGVRLPASTRPGTTDIALVGSSGEGIATRLEVVEVFGDTPSPPAGIVFPTRPSGTLAYPVSTASPFHSVNDLNVSSTVKDRVVPVEWDYNLALVTPGNSDCAGPGIVTGYEARSEVYGRCELNRPQLPPECRPLRGTFEFDASHNWIEITIDRSRVGGTQETYRGGWVTWNAERLAVGPPDPPSTERDYIVLRSTTTGKQIAITHYFRDACVR